MLTQSAPAIINALAGTLPPTAIRALTQALGNCNQPLSHRGPINFGITDPRETGPGYNSGGRWNPLDYGDLLPNAGNIGPGGAVLPGWNPPGAWNTSNYYGDTFQFPVNQEFTLNNYYGGPNVYNAGDQYTNNSYTNNHVANTIDARRINVQVINGVPVGGPAGPQGFRGADGADGANVNVNFDLTVSRENIGPYLKPLFGGSPFVDVMDGLAIETDTIGVPTTVTFDPETCSVSLGGVIDIAYVTAVRRRGVAPLRNVARGGPHRVVRNVF